MLEGKGGLFEFIEQRLRENDHCVLVTAEGAGQNLMEHHQRLGTDESGNTKLLDVGLWLSGALCGEQKGGEPQVHRCVRNMLPDTNRSCLACVAATVTTVYMHE